MKEHTLTKNALSLEMSPFVVESWKQWWSHTRWREPLSYEEITYNISVNTDGNLQPESYHHPCNNVTRNKIDSRNAIAICQFTAPLASSMYVKVMSWPLDNADLSPKLSSSMFLNTSLLSTRYLILFTFRFIAWLTYHIFLVP